MAGRGGGSKQNVSKVVIHKKNATLTVSQGGTIITQFLSARFQNPDQAQSFYEQRGYVVASNRRNKVILIKREG